MNTETYMAISEETHAIYSKAETAMKLRHIKELEEFREEVRVAILNIERVRKETLDKTTKIV